MTERQFADFLQRRLTAARERLQREGWSLVMVSRSGEFHVSRDRGVAPLLDLVDRLGEGLRGAVLADKVVGRAAALVAAGAGIAGIYARVLSEPAREVLDGAGIPVAWKRLVAGIRNRAGDGPCPMEALTLDVMDPLEALARLRRAMGRE